MDGWCFFSSVINESPTHSHVIFDHRPSLNNTTRTERTIHCNLSGKNLIQLTLVHTSPRTGQQNLRPDETRKSNFAYGCLFFFYPPLCFKWSFFSSIIIIINLTVGEEPLLLGAARQTPHYRRHSFSNFRFINETQQNLLLSQVENPLLRTLVTAARVA